MVKAELISKIIENSSEPLTKKAVGVMLESLALTVAKALVDGDDVSFPGICTITKVHKDARPGRNPLTNENITIAARNAVKFKASKALKDAIQ